MKLEDSKSNILISLAFQLLNDYFPIDYSSAIFLSIQRPQENFKLSVGPQEYKSDNISLIFVTYVFADTLNVQCLHILIHNYVL
jgi:hypothetical protein